MAVLQADTDQEVQRYLRPYETYYPGIDDWFEKVWLESATDKRRIWVVISGGALSGLAITKTGKQAKLCHVSLSPSLRGIGVGRRLMGVAVGELLAGHVRTVHVTAGDEIAEEHGGFFERWGFQLVGWARNRYRPGSDELVWGATSETLASRLLSESSLERVRFPGSAGILTYERAFTDLQLKPSQYGYGRLGIVIGRIGYDIPHMVNIHRASLDSHRGRY